MELPSTYRFQDWNVRYNLITSDKVSTPDQAKAKCVVFVHGTPWSSVVYRPIIDALVSRGAYRILIYDLPGYGQSQEITKGDSSKTDVSAGDFVGDTSVKFQALALSALLKHVSLDGGSGHPTPAVIAHDIAGTIVLRAHLLHGCDFDSMMLLDTNTVLPWGDGFYKLVRAQPRPFLELPPSIYEAMLRAVIRSACHDPMVLQAGWEEALARPWIDDPRNSSQKERQRSFVRQIAQANDDDVAEMLKDDLHKQVRCDVKIMWGEQDQWIPKEKIEDLVNKLDGKAKECVYIPNAGHLLMLDQPARFAIEVFDWLNRFGSSKSLVAP